MDQADDGQTASKGLASFCVLAEQPAVPSRQPKGRSIAGPVSHFLCSYDSLKRLIYVAYTRLLDRSRSPSEAQSAQLFQRC